MGREETCPSPPPGALRVEQAVGVVVASAHPALNSHASRAARADAPSLPALAPDAQTLPATALQPESAAASRGVSPCGQVRPKRDADHRNTSVVSAEIGSMSGRMGHGWRLMRDSCAGAGYLPRAPHLCTVRRFTGLAAQVPEAILRENRDERVAAREATANSSEIARPIVPLQNSPRLAGVDSTRIGVWLLRKGWRPIDDGTRPQRAPENAAKPPPRPPRCRGAQYTSTRSPSPRNSHC